MERSKQAAPVDPEPARSAERRFVPFDHWIVRSVIGRDLIDAAFRQIPPPSWPRWVRYENDVERKRTCDALASLPSAVNEALLALISPGVVGFLSSLTGIPDLAADPTCYGGGLHVTDPGGYLGPHIDFEVADTPALRGMERRVNLIVFLNPHWGPNDGGELEFYDDSGSRVCERIAPRGGTSVVWLPGDTTYHGTAQVDPVTGGERASLATYYYAPARPGANRKRSLFVPNRQG